MPVVMGVRLDVAPNLVPTRKVRVLLGHREALEVGHVARSDQVQRVVVGVPMSPDAIGLLKALDLVSCFAQLL